MDSKKKHTVGISNEAYQEIQYLSSYLGISQTEIASTAIMDFKRTHCGIDENEFVSTQEIADFIGSDKGYAYYLMLRSGCEMVKAQPGKTTGKVKARAFFDWLDKCTEGPILMRIWNLLQLKGNIGGNENGSNRSK